MLRIKFLATACVVVFIFTALVASAQVDGGARSMDEYSSVDAHEALLPGYPPKEPRLNPTPPTASDTPTPRDPSEDPYAQGNAPVGGGSSYCPKGTLLLQPGLCSIIRSGNTTPTAQYESLHAQFVQKGVTVLVLQLVVTLLAGWLLVLMACRRPSL